MTWNSYIKNKCFAPGITVGAVCVYPSRVEDAVTSLKAAGASQIPVASGNYVN